MNQYSHSRIPDTDQEEDEYEESAPKHALDSPSICVKLANHSLFLWIFKELKLKVIEFADITSMPNNIKVTHSYAIWRTIYNQRQHNNLSISTKSLIYHTQKHSIHLIIFLQLVATLYAGLIFYIFRHYLAATFYAINDSNRSTLMNDVVYYAVLILIIATLKSLFTSYCWSTSTKMQGQIVSSILMSIYNKCLMLDINECNKQQILSIIGSDVESIDYGFHQLTSFGPRVIFLLIISFFILIHVTGFASLFGILFVFFIGFPLQLLCARNFANSTKSKMKCTDKRVQLISQMIRGIRTLKVTANELPLMDMIHKYRQAEALHISARDFYFGLLILSNFLIPGVMLLLVLLSYSYVFGNDIDSEITLFTLIVLSWTAIAVRGIPVLLGSAVSISVACKRIDEFLNRKTFALPNEKNTPHVHADDTAISIKDGTFIWTESSEDSQSNENCVGFCLNNISLNIKRGRLVAVVGAVGSGKTSLIQSILGEMKCIKGSGACYDTIAYASQTPYIRNATLRQNIVLDLEYDEDKYKQCLVAAALHSDIDKLQEYDLTLIGDDGVNLSGGQKMRVAFARTLYQKDDERNIFIFDDALSSVDMYVGRHMFVEGIYKYLLNHNNTILMVINSHLHLLQYFDEIIIMDGGQIKAHCPIKDLLFENQDSNTDLYDTYSHLLPDKIQSVNPIDIEDNDTQRTLIANLKLQSDERCMFLYEFDENHQYKHYNNTAPGIQTHLDFVKSAITEFDHTSHWCHNEEQIRKSDDMRNNYQNMMSLLMPVLLTFIIQCCLPVVDIWILVWNKQVESNPNLSTFSGSLWYLIVWIAILAFIAFSIFYLVVYFGKLSNRASDYIHNKALLNILRANTLFFDITPCGEIMNRFTKDTNDMDVNLPIQVYKLVLFTSSLIGYYMTIFILIPFSLIPFLCILPIMLYVMYRYKLGFYSTNIISQQLNAPIIQLFNETVCNLDSIRAYKLQHYFKDLMKRRINNGRKVRFLCLSLSGWNVFYVGMIVNFMQFFIIIIASFQVSKYNNKGLIILCCWYFLAIQTQTAFSVSMFYNTQKRFASVVRLFYYHHLFEENKQMGCEIAHEAPQIHHDYKVAKHQKWPSCGDVQINKLQLKYREKFDIVLNIDREIVIKHGSKVGICGRTGSGKSSILVSIFRLFEPMKDSEMIIDNLDILKLGLHDLRSNLSIISQTPILFGNVSLRFNLDPFEKYNDDQIWDALQFVQLADLIHLRDDELDCMVNENGSNFSEGQKQLICFARAILNKSSILFMDEATSSIDKHTDGIIQKLIRSDAFREVTVITVAHRIQTIMDYDYILVMNNGQVVEYDTPQHLLESKDTFFARLVHNNQ
eukprot:1946_1